MEFWFSNVNTPQEFAEAEAWAAAVRIRLRWRRVGRLSGREIWHGRYEDEQKPQADSLITATG